MDLKHSLMRYIYSIVKTVIVPSIKFDRQLASNWCNLGGGSVWDVVAQPNPDIFGKS